MSSTTFLSDDLWLGLQRLLKNQDLKTISVQNICEEVGIHRATFYRYHADIFDLIDYGLRKELTTYLKQIIDDKGSQASFALFLQKIQKLEPMISHLQETKHWDLIKEILYRILREMTSSALAKHSLTEVRSYDHFLAFYSGGFQAFLCYFINTPHVDIELIAADIALNL